MRLSSLQHPKTPLFPNPDNVRHVEKLIPVLRWNGVIFPCFRLLAPSRPESFMNGIPLIGVSPKGTECARDGVGFLLEISCWPGWICHSMGEGPTARQQMIYNPRSGRKTTNQMDGPLALIISSFTFPSPSGWGRKGPGLCPSKPRPLPHCGDTDRRTSFEN